MRPPWHWLPLEVRALSEAASLPALRPWLAVAPRGDGHPVLVLPGFMAGDWSTRPLRRYLRAQGWDAQGWGMGANLDAGAACLAAVLRRLDALAKASGQRVSLVGWSLGGLLAREAARERPDSVRQLITLGSPLHDDPRRTSTAWPLYRLLNGRQAHAHAAAPGAAPVPTTSIFGRRDGVVAWRACVERPGAQVQNIATPGSHFGYGVNPLVWWLLADRLAQPEDGWRPFAPPPALRALVRPLP